MRGFQKQHQHVELSEIRSIDMVAFLGKLGFEPQKIRGVDFWYLSPLRNEKTASFKINTKLNRWYDHGIGKGGNLIDFLLIYHQCTFKEVIEMFSGESIFHQRVDQNSRQISQENSIVIHQVESIRSAALKRYLFPRKIPLEIASKFCQQVTFSTNEKKHTTLGFRNDLGGYELRSDYYKISSRPKDVTTIDWGLESLAVFEGFFDFLSYLTIHQNSPEASQNFVILNSVSLFDRARSFLEKHIHVDLYLDSDDAGKRCTSRAQAINEKYKDASSLYEGFKDVNDWLIHEQKSRGQGKE